MDGTSTNVKILSICAWDKSKNGFVLTDLVDAVDYAIEQNVDVINMSLGVKDATSELLKTYILQAINNNIPVVVAAGNDSTDASNFFPANMPEVVTVSALTSSKLIYTLEGTSVTVDDASLITAENSTTSDLSLATEFSNYGNEIDYCAPGNLIIGLVNSSTNSETGILSGTSQAAPYITAAIATIKSYNKNLTNSEVEKALDYYTVDLGTTGKDIYYGKGYINFKNVQECTCGSENCYGIYCKGCTNAHCIYCNSGIVLSNISIESLPTKTTYVEGESLNTAGLKIKVTYSNNTTDIIDTGFSCDITVLNTVGTQLVTVTYNGKTTTFNVTVEKENIEVLKDSSNYKINSNYIQNVSAKTNISDFLNNINDGLTVVIKKSETIVSSGNIGTGMVVIITQNNKTVGEYIIIITGDTNGNGTVVLQDVVNTMKQYNNKKLLNGVYLMAVDTNNDGTITLLELIKEIKLYKQFTS